MTLNRAKQNFVNARIPSSDVGVVSSLLSGKGMWSSDSRDGCFKGNAAHFDEDRNASKNMCKQMSGKGNQNKSWSMSELSSSGKGKNRECERLMQR